MPLYRYRDLLNFTTFEPIDQAYPSLEELEPCVPDDGGALPELSELPDLDEKDWERASLSPLESQTSACWSDEPNDPLRPDPKDIEFSLQKVEDYNPPSKIRLMKLKPGDFNDDIHISLEEAPFGIDDTPTDYETVSYVWGSTENPVTVYVDDQDQPGAILKIGPNLAEALRYLRLKDAERCLWADAICINQEDLAERCSQVILMGYIYDRCRRVVVWAGLPDEHSGPAMELLGAIHDAVGSLERSTYTVTLKSEAESKILHFGDKHYLALSNFLRRPWFWRVWIRQEVKRPSEGVFLCGEDSISLLTIRDSLFAIYYNRYFVNRVTSTLGFRKGSQFRDVLYDTMELFYPCGVYFGFLRSELQRVQCSDDRDRVYGILGILEKSEQGLQILPHYNLTTGECYRNVALKHIRHHKLLDLLRECNLSPRDATPPFPTWVPDFATPSTSLDLSWGVQMASSDFQSVWDDTRAIEDGLLTVAAVSVGTISTAKLFGTDKPLEQAVGIFLDELHEMWRDARSCPRITQRYSTGTDGTWTDPLSAFCVTMGIGQYYDLNTSRDETWTVGHAVAALKRSLSPNFDRQAKDMGLSYFEYISKISCSKHAFVQTSNGYMGLAPRETQLEDEAFVLLGCKEPMLLRPDGDRYLVVGKVYMPGVNFGEALLGPLPPSVSVKKCYVKEVDGWVNGYHKDLPREQGFSRQSFGREDPRMDNFSSDLAEYKRRCKDIVVDRDAAQKSRMPENRCEIVRCDLEVLRGLGVDIRMITLA